MKSILRISIVAMTLWIVSCDNLSDINVDPNNSSTARPQEVLSSALGYLAFIMDTQYNREAYLWGQYWTWGTGVSLGDNARYLQEPRDADQVWARSYRDVLADLRFLKSVDDPAYNGIAKALEAYVYQYLVDHFGDVPYSQAVQGAIEDGSILAPTFDDDATIYPALITTLDEAMADLALALTATVQSVGAEDFVYGGDLNGWMKFANSLKLRIALRMSDVQDVSAEVAEVMAAGAFIESAADIAELQFSGASGSENPMFAWEESGIGLFYKAGAAVTDVMDELNDPRKFYFYDEAVNFPGEIRSAHQNVIAIDFDAVDEDWSDPSAVTYSAAASTIFMSDWEVWFLRAEAAIKYNTGEDAAQAFANAIVANFAYIGAPGGADFAASLNFAAGSTQDQLTNIAIQKWISMTGLQEAEGWIESRRFDTPENPIFTGANGIYETPEVSSLPDGVFPSRWLYPESEQNLNVNAPAQVLVTGKVFWDR